MTTSSRTPARVLTLALMLGALVFPAQSAQAQDELQDLKAKQKMLEEDARRVGERLKALEAGKASAAELEALKAELEEARVQLEASRRRQREELQAQLDAMAGEEGDEGDDDGPEIELSGFVRGSYDAVYQSDDNNLAFVGQNDGFALNNARLTLDATYRELVAKVQFDGAIARLNSDNNARGRVETDLRDAWFEYQPFRERDDEALSEVIKLRVGRYRPPFDGTSLIRTKNLLFIERAVAIQGVNGVQGRNLPGLESFRELGAMAHGRYLHGSGAGVGYSLAVMNGNGAGDPFNDNDSLAYYGRLEGLYKEAVVVGVAYALNARTSGDAPDLIDEDEAGLAADVRVDLMNVLVQAQFVQFTRSFPNIPVEPDTTSTGYHVSLGYRFPLGIIPSYRYAFYDPTSDAESDDSSLAGFDEADELTYHTLGLTWDVPDRPFKLQANYTITVESDEQALDNDRLQIMGQFRF